MVVESTKNFLHPIIFPSPSKMVSSFCLAACSPRRRRLSPVPLLCRNIAISADPAQSTSKPVSAPEPLTLKLSEDSFQSHNFDLRSLEGQVTKDEPLQMYQELKTTRKTEMAADALHKTKMICHLAVGRGTASVGMQHGDEPDDGHRQLPPPLPLPFLQMFRAGRMCTSAMYGSGASNQRQVFELYSMVRFFVVL
ncbi:hypothetical protein BKA70DRAFT_1558913 [Coprinopsis sp. MPI-PUGE-AT-0042]|nr:hypothetical protein BKA70DRAFT_1558913 [Coprinopsis sp. MPI-PUGE-AT-0042]